MNRSQLRRVMRARRRQLTPQQQALAARRLMRLLRRQPLFVRSRHIAFYLASDGEINPAPLLELAWRAGKCCYLPALARGADGRLRFARYRPGSRLRPNRYGIPEPAITAGNCLPAAALDLVLLPLVAFDPSGARLGMGGGYYDRTFAFKQRLPAQQPYLLGLAHQCQQVEALATAHWDIPLHAVATDGGLIPCTASANRRNFSPGDRRWQSPKSGERLSKLAILDSR
ncbi:5-formyltetrahydrofolate cyclo-ligase [Exilibacterium tricleocarpae]|uniref:5-formyltetrahydrofolate cyclo-ligase n=1 Tax=Exilibacterium tricleocarpae TaxID=2591008 RepID=UPI001FE4BD14|nr:5-formyltetrahydrofolate cyclo-ligase [Exilibacterium tricleocarpae]